MGTTANFPVFDWGLCGLGKPAVWKKHLPRTYLVYLMNRKQCVWLALTLPAGTASLKGCKGKVMDGGVGWHAAGQVMLPSTVVWFGRAVFSLDGFTRRAFIFQQDLGAPLCCRLVGTPSGFPKLDRECFCGLLINLRGFGGKAAMPLCFIVTS